MYRILYWLFLLVFTLISLMPLKVHYFFSYILYFFLYKVFRYRTAVVFTNISRSFPEADYGEVKTIVKDFYKSLADTIVESIWAFTASRKSIGKHFYFEGVDVLNEVYGQGRNVMVIISHLGNWELYTGMPDLKKTFGLNMDNSKFIFVYKRMSNKFFDKVLYAIRTRHKSCSLVDNRNIVRTMLRGKEQGGVYYFIADQHPGNGTSIPVEFLNQPTGMINGPELIARKLGMPVLFNSIERVRRGCYRTGYVKICDDASTTEEGFVTKEYAKLLETAINNNKSSWLWSHRRWKNKKKI